MPLNSIQINSLILSCLSQAENGRVSVNNLYAFILQTTSLDASDSAFTRLRSEDTTEPSWKRNVRNVLKHAKDLGELANPDFDTWQLPIPNGSVKINVSIAWDFILEEAENAYKNNTVFLSKSHLRRYRISNIEKKKITIQRLDAVGQSILTRNGVNNALKALNASGGSVTRGSLIRNVAKEAILVYLHPDLDWKGDQIIIKDTTELSATSTRNSENTNRSQYAARKIRQGQGKFRMALLYAYQRKCCISGTGPINVLQAAHIEAHSIRGLNLPSNGLLLRSDLHDLFDDNLIGINPQTFCIKIHPSLKDTDYWQFHNKTLMERIDGSSIEIQKLRERWDKIDWTSPVE